MNKNEITKEFLAEEYINNKKSINRIHKETGLRHRLIVKSLKLYQIQKRTHSEATTGTHKKVIKVIDKKYYCECGNEIHWSTGFYGSGICSKCSWLNRGNKERHQKHFCIDCKETEICYDTWHIGGKRCLSCALLERIKNPKNSPSYIDGRSSTQYFCIDCGKKISVASGLYGKSRCPSCSKIGELSPLYINGEGNFPYSIEFTDILKISIRDRDNHECQICHIKEEELNEKLSIHHIDYNKQNCNPKNLISLCNPCHIKTNHNRENWIEYFEEELILCQKI